jgi:hypothetical protein
MTRGSGLILFLQKNCLYKSETITASDVEKNSDFKYGFILDA